MNPSKILKKIPEATVIRLSLYLRCLNLLKNEGLKTISSKKFEERFQISSAQLRKDLAYFGGFGRRGKGYDIEKLYESIENLLDLKREKKLIIVGAGHLGQALGDFQGFNSGGFKTVALFDNDKEKIGKFTKKGKPILDVNEMEEFIKKEKVKIGVIAVHPSSAQEIYDKLVKSGIKGILNFAPIQIKEKENIITLNVDLKIKLENISFYLKHNKIKK